MPINFTGPVGGYNVYSNNGLCFGETSTKIVAANYGISDPTLPGMFGSATGGSGTYKVYPFPVNNVSLNIGSPWSTSTNRFTAPVAGIYYISYGGIVGSGAVNGYFAIIVNGSYYYFSYRDTDNTWECHHTEVMIKLAAGDWVSWAMNIAPGPDTGSACGAYQANHNGCVIWLVG